MSIESKKVLDLLVDGKIDVEEAERLLGALSRREPFEADDEQHPPGSSGPRPSPRFLRVLVDAANGDHVNVRVPLKLIATGIRLGAMLPSQARAEMERKGINFDELGKMPTDELLEALEELTVDVDGANGDIVQVFCE